MIETLKKIFGIGPKVDLAEVMRRGAQVIDVRTKSEYANGHAKGSVNIPLDTLRNQMKHLDRNKPVITCCASGMRSASAKNILLSSGFSEVYNGGSWANVQRHRK